MAKSKTHAMGGSGFLFPPFSLALDNQSLVVGSDQSALVGNITFTPDGADLILLDSDGEKFMLNDDGDALLAGPVATTSEDGSYQNVQIRVSFGGRSFDSIVRIDLVTDPVSGITFTPTTTTDDADGLYVINSDAGTVIGVFDTDPDGVEGVTYALDESSQSFDGFEIVDNQLEASGTSPDYGTYAIVINAILNDTVVASQTFNIKVDDAP